MTHASNNSIFNPSISSWSLRRQIMAAVVALSLASLALVAVTSSSGRAGADWSQTFEGTVDSSGEHWATHVLDVPAGTLELQLAWSGEADLNMFLKNPAGTGIARATSDTDNPERLTFDLVKPGQYRLGVKALKGATSYVLIATVVVPQPEPTDSPTPDPEPSATDGPSPEPDPTKEPDPQPSDEPTKPTDPTDEEMLRSWAPVHEHPPATMTLSEAVATAKAHDLITAGPKTYAPYTEAMRQANPRLRILVYLNGTFAQETQGSAYPDSWYSRDNSGSKIRSSGFGNFLMRPEANGWVDNRVATCRDLIQKSGYDGCMLDMLGIAPLGAGYGTGLPINPATGQVWTRAAWLGATGALAAQVKSATGRYTLGNGLGSGNRYFATDGPTRVLLNGIDAGIAESWLRTAHQSVTSYPTESKWRQAVDALRDAGSRDRDLVVMVKLWANGTEAQKDAWHEYALASFLLGTDGRAMFSASYGSSTNLAAEHSWWSKSVGLPEGQYYKSGSLYRRDFAKAVVLVNPTSSPQAVSVSTQLRSLTGETTTNNIPAYGARILLR